jgi:3-dehydroquinate synthase
MRKTFRRLHQPEDPYPVLFGRGLLEQAGALAKGLWGGRRIAVVTHRKLAELYGKTLCARLKAAGADTHLFHIPEGEGSKNLETVRHLYGRLVQYHFGREDGLIALGGGVVGDTAGFVAATYLRGIGLIQIPTSLLAQIDSAIGAKVGVNLPQGKNLIGAFHRPAAVWIDPNVLTTLPPRELRSGLFEMLKYGFIRSPALFRQMERSHDVFRPKTPVLEKAIALAVRAKLAVVREDERETGSRRILNFGHTIGHGLEAAGAYHNLSHGEAVGWGMIAAVWLAWRNELIDTKLAERMEKAVRTVAPLPSLERLGIRPIMRAIDRDKKIGTKGFRFVLPAAVGRVTVVEGFPRKEILWAVHNLIRHRSPVVIPE